MIKIPFVTVYTLTFNEEHMIEFFVNHYRRMFPNCIIHVFDNGSTDKTVEIAKSLRCEIHYFDSKEYPGEFDERDHIFIKNNEWKNASTDWVVCCDCDELGMITQSELLEEQRLGFNVIQFTCWDMINNKNDHIDLAGMKYGLPHKSYDKKILFNKKYVKEINYNWGSHQADPKGEDIKEGSSKPYTMAHYKWISLSHSLKRRDSNNDRWCKWMTEDMWKGHPKWAVYCPDQHVKGWFKKPLVEVEGLR